MIPQPVKRFVQAVLASSVAAIPVLAADDPPVYYTAPNNQIRQVIDFARNKTQTVITAKGTNFQDLVVRPDEIIVVANKTHGGQVLACDPSAGSCATIVGFADAHGLALDVNQNVFVVNDKPGTGQPDRVGRIPRKAGCPPGLAVPNPNPLGCRPGGYGDLVLVDPDVRLGGGSAPRSDRLADVAFVSFDNGLLDPGDIVVLVRKPAAALRYRLSGAVWQRSVFIPPESFPFGSDPTGGVFVSDDAFRVITWGGKILEFNSNGVSQPDFDSALGGKGAKISFGIQNGQSRLFATVHTNGAFVRRYNNLSDPTDKDDVTTNVQAPEGVGIETADAAPVRAGSNVTALLPALETKLAVVNTSGHLRGDCQTHDDPRAPYMGNNSDKRLALCAVSSMTPFGPCPAVTGDAVLDLGLPNIIPHYARGFKRIASAGQNQSNASGPETIRVCQLSTTADVDGVTKDKSDEENWLGYHADCTSPFAGPAAFKTPPQVFFAREEADDQGASVVIAENQTSVCNFDGDDRWGASVVIPTLRDMRPVDGEDLAAACADAGYVDCDDPAVGIAECQFANLCSALESVVGVTCDDDPTALRERLDDAIAAFNGDEYTPADFDAARDLICCFEEEVQEVTSCDTDELVARARAMKYQMCRLITEEGEASSLADCIAASCSCPSEGE